jgi:hypothetical protein
VLLAHVLSVSSRSRLSAVDRLSSAGE